MNTFKKLMVCSAVSAIALFASADVLYWQVESPDSGATFDSADLYVTGGSLGDSTSRLASVVPFDGTPGSMTDLTQTDLGVYGGEGSPYSFFVELVNYSGSSLGANNRAYTYSYNELVSAGYIATNPFDSSSAAAAASAGNMGSPTPEPTSGMLLLIGGSLLALRRRSRQA
jgi:hypothetical protein